MNAFTAREHVASILVAALGSAFGVALLHVTGVLAVVLTEDDTTGASATVAVLLAVVAVVFIVIALYVATIVTANTFATIIAGRTRVIALVRLIGATAAQQRRAVAREGLLVGAIGAGLGVIAGTLSAVGVTSWAAAASIIEPVEYDWMQPLTLLPAGAVVLTTWAASWVGSRRVLTVTPMQALGGAQELTREETVRRPVRNGLAIASFAIGGLLLGVGIAVGLVSPLGVLIGLVGGIFSFSGLVAGAHLVMPPVLRLVGRALGGSTEARLAAENAVRYPERSSRVTIGLVIGVTLVTMFAVAVESYQLIIRRAQEAQPEVYQGVDDVLVATVVVFSVLVGFSALIAAVGMVNTLSLSVMQRTRELGLLRALGFTAPQVRRMIRFESAQLTLASVALGLVLGVLYGWAGAQSLLGAIDGSPGLVVPAVPLALLAVVAVGAATLTVVASLAPARRATRVSPVAALAVE